MQAITAIVSVVIGFLLGLIPPWLTRKKRAKAHLGAIKAESSICEKQAQQFLENGVASPLYRLPKLTFQASLLTLLADGSLAEDEVDVLTKFHINVEALNRGLDNVDMIRRGGLDPERKVQIGKETARNAQYVKELITLYPEVSRVIDAHK
jgi:hypothetical protein